MSLWCLLQEVREGVSGCKWRAEENVARSEGRDLSRAQVEERNREGATLVEELKERAGVVEGQWGEALGGEMGRCKAGVRGWLEGTGGWDEELEEGGEGGSRGVRACVGTGWENEEGVGGDTRDGDGDGSRRMDIGVWGKR